MKAKRVRRWWLGHKEDGTPTVFTAVGDMIRLGAYGEIKKFRYSTGKGKNLRVTFISGDRVYDNERAAAFALRRDLQAQAERLRKTLQWFEVVCQMVVKNTYRPTRAK